MILELDLGNTYCKWRILDKNGLVPSRGLGERQHWLQGVFPNEWGDAISEVKVASVLGDAIEQELNLQLSQRLACPVRWARSSQNCAGVRNAYPSPERLGVDRWLAAVAAYQKARRAVLVCDIGSALTIDLVDRNGLHRGGYIIPGPRLMVGALLTSTDRVRFAESDLGIELDPGSDTGTCVGNGVTIAMTGAVMVALRRAEIMLQEPVAVYLSGGYRQSLKSHLRAMGLSGTHSEADLVLDGLRWALP